MIAYIYRISPNLPRRIYEGSMVVWGVKEVFRYLCVVVMWFKGCDGKESPVRVVWARIELFILDIFRFSIIPADDTSTESNISNNNSDDRFVQSTVSVRSVCVNLMEDVNLMQDRTTSVSVKRNIRKRNPMSTSGNGIPSLGTNQYYKERALGFAVWEEPYQPSVMPLKHSPWYQPSKTADIRLKKKTGAVKEILDPESITGKIYSSPKLMFLREHQSDIGLCSSMSIESLMGQAN